MKKPDTNMSAKNQDGELDNSFLLDENMPGPTDEFKKHMAVLFADMGLSLDEVKQLISAMK